MWDHFGLQKNPFEIKAVEIGGLVPITTFTGRTEDRQNLQQAIKNHNHSLNLIVGDRGVGKTSLGNIVRSDLFEKFFTPLNEIDTQHTWKSADFIEHALLSIYETTFQAKTHTTMERNYLRACDEVSKIIHPIFTSEQGSFGVQFAGFGIDTGSGQAVTKLPFALLKLKVKEAIDIVRRFGYSGIILQYNNLDNIEIEPKKLSKLFADLRDFLVTENLHIILSGNKIMEEGIKYNSKVNECITSDYHIGSLPKNIITQIIEKRYEAFKIENRAPTPPVSKDSIEMLCELYNGNIRQVFFSLDHAVIYSEKILGKIKQLNKEEVKKILNEAAKKKINKQVDQRAMEVLHSIIEKNKDITNTEITKKLKLKAQNTSKYLKQLKENDLIIQSDRMGRKIYYRAVHEAKWLLLKPETGVAYPLSNWNL